MQGFATQLVTQLAAFLLGSACMAQSEAQPDESRPGSAHEPAGTEASTPAAEGGALRGRRAKTQDLWNGAFNRTLLQDPRDAEAELARVQERIEEINPADPGDRAVGNVLFHRGYLAAEDGRYEKAIGLFEEIVRRFPRHAYADDALYRIGDIYQRHLREYDKAAAAYTRLAKAYEDRENASPAMYQKAQIAVQRGQVADANKFLSKARDNARSQRFRRGQTYNPNHYEEQSGQMLVFIEKNTKQKADGEALSVYLTGNNDLQERRLVDAARNFVKIQDRFPRSALADDAAFGLAECRRLAGRLDEAAKAYEGFLAEHPSSELAPQARFQLAEFRRLAGDEDGARLLYAQVVAATETSPQALGPGEGQAGRQAKPSEELRRLGSLAARRLEELGAPSRSAPAAAR